MTPSSAATTTTSTRPRPVVAVVSMLHEGDARHSANRLLDRKPVLSHTLDRLGQTVGVDAIVVLCWEDQTESATSAASESATIVPLGQRQHLADVEAVASAQRWADGWRGGLLGTCPADRGFHAESAQSIAEATEADALLFVDASFARLDSTLTADLIAHFRDLQSAGCGEPVYFMPSPPGSTGLLVPVDTVARLAKETDPRRRHPGRLLHYMPEAPRLDVVTSPACRHASDPAIGRDCRDLRIDSTRRLTGDATRPELQIDLTSRRLTRPVWLREADASDLELTDAVKAIADAAKSADDLRVTFGGLGDPLLHPAWPQAVAAARTVGAATHVETDLVGITPAALEHLTLADVVSVHLPAMTAATYASVMGRNVMGEVVANLAKLLELAQSTGLIVVPTFVKLRTNVGEMEAWYDQWLTAAGSAVIRGPDAFDNQPPAPVTDLAAAPLVRSDRSPTVIHLPARRAA